MIFRYIGFCTAWLDKRLNWSNQVVARLLAQLLPGVIGASLIACSISYGQYKWIDPEHVFGTQSFWEVEFPVIVLVVSFVNSIYVGVSYYQWQLQQGRDLPTSEPVIHYAKSLVAVNGHRNMQVPAEQIALICLEHGLTWVVTFNDTRYHLDDPLHVVMQRLDPNSFFRVNRQIIVQLSACYSYQSVEHGKIMLKLVPPFTTELLISQKTAPSFRKWMQR